MRCIPERREGVERDPQGGDENCKCQLTTGRLMRIIQPNIPVRTVSLHLRTQLRNQFRTNSSKPVSEQVVGRPKFLFVLYCSGDSGDHIHSP